LTSSESLSITRVIAKLEPGGAQLGALNLTLALRDCGIESHILAGHSTPEGLDLFADHGIEVETFASPHDLQYECSREFAGWLGPRLAGAELVHGQMFGAWWAAAEAVPADAPLVGSEHNAVRWPGPPRVEQMRAALQRIDLFFATGPASRALVLELGLPAERLRVGIAAVVGAPARQREGLPARRLVYASRLHHEKGPDLLLDAVALLERPPPTFLLGAGPLEPALRQQVAALGLDEVAQFVGWQAEPGPWIAGAAACVIPSRHEARSLTALLAMALGVPVVGTAVEGMPELMAEGRGLLVAPDDPEALAFALEGVLARRRLPNLAAARAYAMAHTQERVAAYYAEAYRSLVTRNTKAPAAL